MSVTAPQRLLWDAQVLPLPEAAEAWRRWRAATDLDRLDPGSFHLLPALAGRLPAWLSGDPQASLLLGICRRAWSRNQFARKPLAQAAEILAAAGIDRTAVTGPALWGEMYWPSDAIRPVGRLDLLVDSASARRASEALTEAGWKIPDAIPEPSQADFAPASLVQSPAGGEARLHWRALPNTDFALRRPRPAPLPLPDAYSLVAALGGELADELSWHFDALMICRRSKLDWETVAALLRFRTSARARLDELRRDWGAEIPPAVTKPSPTHGLERICSTTLRAYRRIVR